MLYRLLSFARVVDRLEHQVGNVDRALALDDGTLGVLLGLLGVALDQGDALDAGAALRRQDLEDLAFLAPVGAGDDDDGVVTL
jgi:hypothetical protein